MTRRDTKKAGIGRPSIFVDFASFVAIRTEAQECSRMKHLRIALYPGDGIGPEVITQAVRVLHR